MPTGYTHGIIKGEITTFEEFARQCVRAFGAAIHMRDEPLDREWEPRTPSDYHYNKIKELEGFIDEIEALLDNDCAFRKESELKEQLSIRKSSVKEAEICEEKLKLILHDVKKWQPPSEDHNDFKSFMINQLEETIKFDGVSDWQLSQIKETEKALNNIVGCMVKQQYLNSAKRDLEYHREEYKKELERCENANQWAIKLFESLSNPQLTNKDNE